MAASSQYAVYCYRFTLSVLTETEAQMPAKLPKVLTEDERQALLAHLNTRYPTPHRNL